VDLLLRALGIQIRGEIEEKPGIPPSQDYLASADQEGVGRRHQGRVVDTIYPTKDGQFIADKTGAKIVSSPIDVGGAQGTDDYFSLINTLLDRTLGAAK